MNSLDLYQRILAVKSQDSSFDGRKAVTALITKMALELIEEKTSPLLNACVYVLGRREHLYIGHVYRFQRFDLDLRNPVDGVSAADAAVLIRCLAQLVSNGQIRNNVIYDVWYESFGTSGTTLGANAERAYYLVRMIESYLPDYEARINHSQKDAAAQTEEPKTDEQNITQPDEKQVSEEQAQQIIKEAQEKARAIIAKAEQEATEILKNAQNVSDQKIRKAAEQAKQMNVSRNLETFETQQNEIHTALSEIRRRLNETGAYLNQIDQKINDETVMKIFDQYDELYNLIADVADSTAANMDGDSPDLRRVYQNHQAYLDLIEENLSDFGIEYLATSQGEPFDGRKHEVSGSKNFDPRSAKVKKSLRHGFVYGKSVLKKELVELQEEQSNVYRR